MVVGTAVRIRARSSSVLQSANPRNKSPHQGSAIS
jgi:hypothetical protein